MTSTSDAGTSRGRLVVTSPGARIDVLDAWLGPVPGGGVLDRLDVELPAGAYEVRMRIGAAEERALVVVRSGGTHRLQRSVRFAAAAPVEGTLGFDDDDAEVAWLATQDDGGQRRDEALVVVVRGRDAVMDVLGWPPPFELVDAVGPPPTPVVARRRPGTAIGWRLPVAPGPHRIRWRTSVFEQIEQALWVAPGWQTVAFVPWDEGALPELMSVHLVAAGESWSPVDADALAVEALAAHLRSGAGARPDEPASENPLTVLLTEHQRLRALGTAGAPPAAHALELLQATFGADQPDVAVLTGTSRVSRPPMLSASLDRMLAVHARIRFIAPGDLLEGLAAQRYSGGPWLRWNPIGLDGRRGGSMPPNYRVRGRDPYGRPPPVAVDRLADLLRSTALTMDVPIREIPYRLSLEEIAERLGTTPAFVERALDAALSRATEGNESLVEPRLERRFTRLRDV